MVGTEEYRWRRQSSYSHGALGLAGKMKAINKVSKEEERLWNDVWVTSELGVWAGCLTQFGEWRKASRRKRCLSLNFSMAKILKWSGPSVYPQCLSHSSCSGTRPLSILFSLRTFVHAFSFAWNFLISLTWGITVYPMRSVLHITPTTFSLCLQDEINTPSLLPWNLPAFQLPTTYHNSNYLRIICLMPASPLRLWSLLDRIVSSHYLCSEQLTQYPKPDKYSAFHFVNKNQDLKHKKE